MTKAESVEALLSPSLRVSRPVAACSRCRGAKIKCDGRLPACTACEKAGKGSSCSGANDDFAKGKERSYVAALESACERLQQRIAEVRAARGPDGQIQGSSSPPGSSGGRPRGMSRRQKQEASDVDDLVGDFGFLSVNATSRDFHGFTGTISFAKLLLIMSTKRELPQPQSTQLPPRYYGTQLVQRYLDTVYVLMPLMAETDLMASLAAVYQDTGRQARPFDQWTVRMVLAIVMASMAPSKNSDAEMKALQQVSAALEVAEEVLHPGSIAGLQAILLLTQYSMIDPQHFRSWQLLGTASRVLVDLGLHQEPSVDAKVDKDILEIRRRVFHTLYCIDRQISMANYQPFSFTDDSTAVKLPIMQQTPPGSDQTLFLHSIQPFFLLSEIRRIQSIPYQTLNESGRQPFDDPFLANEYVWSVFSNAQRWYENIPGTISQQHRSLFELELLYTHLFILSPSVRIQRVPLFHKGLIFELSVEYAEKMWLMVQNIGLHPFLSYSDMLRVKNVGKIFLDTLWNAYDEILSGHIAVPRTESPDPNIPRPPAYSPSTDMLSNVDRALRFLNLTIGILEYAYRRWDDGDLRAKFEQEATVIMGKLSLKQAQLRQRHGTNPAKQATRSLDSQLSDSHAMMQPPRQSPTSQTDPPWPDLGYRPHNTDVRASQPSYQSTAQHLQRKHSPAYPIASAEQDLRYFIADGQPQLSRHPSDSNRR